MREYLCPILCSTTSDLAEARTAVAALLVDLKASEHCVAFWDDSQELIELRKRRIAFANLLLIIVGREHDSSTSQDTLLSLKAEYYSRHGNTPCLIYFCDTRPRLGVPSVIRSRNAKMLEEFKAELLSRHNVTHFRNTQSLCARVHRDLRPSVRKVRNRNSIHESRRQRIFHGTAKRLEEEYYLHVEPGYWHRYYDIENSGRIFVSYCHHDTELVLAVIEKLRENGIYVTFDGTFAHGMSFVTQIASTLCSIRCFIVFVSRACLSSDWVRSELSFALSRNKSEPHRIQIIPVLVDDVMIPRVLDDNPHIDLPAVGISRAVNIISELVKPIQEDLNGKRLDSAKELVQYLGNWANTLNNLIESANGALELKRYEKIKRALKLLSKITKTLNY